MCESSPPMDREYQMAEVDCAKKDPEGERRYKQIRGNEERIKAVFVKSITCLEGILGVKSQPL